MHADFAEGTVTPWRGWELKASAFYRTFNAMLANEIYVENYGAYLRIEIKLFDKLLF